MKIRLDASAAEKIGGEWLVVSVFKEEDGTGLPPPLAGRVRQLRQGEDFEGKRGELLALHGVDGVAARRVLLVGLGPASECQRVHLHRAASAAAKLIASKQRARVVFQLFGDPAGAVPPADRCAELVAGALVGSTGQSLYRAEKARRPFEELIIATGQQDQEPLLAGVHQGEIVGEAINTARELVNLTPEDIYPKSFCNRAKRLIKEHELDIAVDILGPKELEEQKMRCILGVGAGSERKPRLLVLTYRGAAPHARRLCFVGKGITFDSGGLSLKPTDNMLTMKYDMSGAAAVLSAGVAIARLKLPVNLLVIAPLAENMPSGSSFKLGDVLRAKNGKTIEVVNTDAEGRLVLADALSHAVDLGASHIVDLATLTGACVVALGNDVAGLMTNDQTWADRVLAAATRTGERVWQLPMFEEYDELIKSDVADMKNSGGRWGGAISAAKLLAEFVGNTPWTHIDLAGPSFAEKERPYQDGGGTGFFVRTLIELAHDYIGLASGSAK